MTTKEESRQQLMRQNLLPTKPEMRMIRKRLSIFRSRWMNRNRQNRFAGGQKRRERRVSDRALPDFSLRQDRAQGPDQARGNKISKESRKVRPLHRKRKNRNARLKTVEGLTLKASEDCLQVSETSHEGRGQCPDLQLVRHVTMRHRETSSSLSLNRKLRRSQQCC